MWEINLGIPSRVKESKKMIKDELLSYNQEMSLDPVNWETPQRKMGIGVFIPRNALHHKECCCHALQSSLLVIWSSNLRWSHRTSPRSASWSVWLLRSHWPECAQWGHSNFSGTGCPMEARGSRLGQWEHCFWASGPSEKPEQLFIPNGRVRGL